MPAINPVAVIAAAVVAMVIGGVYYLPALMGTRMMALAKVYVERAPSRAMAIQVVFTLVAMCALTVLVQLAGARDPVAGATVAFWAWLLLAFGRRGPNELLRAALVAVGHQPGELDHHVSRRRRGCRLLLVVGLTAEGLFLELLAAFGRADVLPYLKVRARPLRGQATALCGGVTVKN